jgi:lipid-binding SYLF domain-containing protein
MKQTLITLLVLLPFVAAGCKTAPEKKQGKEVLDAQVTEAVNLFKIKDPSIDRFFNDSYGYAVLPQVFKGGFFVGGAYGRGEVFEKGEKVGYCDMSQATLGFSFGGQYFREIVFFRDEPDFDKFKAEEYTFAAQVTGVALSAGVAAKADYKAGLAVFVMEDKGLMVDVSLGGQKFRYQPVMPALHAIPSTPAK